MKTYRTIDLLNAVYNGKIFKHDFKNAKTGRIITQGTDHTKDGIYNSDQSKCFFWVGSGMNFINVKDMDTPLQLEEFLEEEWEEVQEPVSFMEAMTKCKPIRVEHKMLDRWEYQYADDLLQKMGDCLTLKEIKEIVEHGKWYIKEDEE
ncbi:hypothetical protein AB8U03_15550 [Clostridium sp. Mt-5]|uniref:Uncharacterized protein n=1 Tax=Clostridium moutaii TaxID=3240932 RepID=A0ABV4BS24_9CLOT